MNWKATRALLFLIIQYTKIDYGIKYERESGRRLDEAVVSILFNLLSYSLYGTKNLAKEERVKYQRCMSRTMHGLDLTKINKYFWEILKKLSTRLLEFSTSFRVSN